jgi:glutathione synthase/RimK-type ligase-like ATP-grasp enzyme
MKIAIHYRKGLFSERWIAYCEEQRIPYKIVDCYDTDIINQLEDCDVLMWHYMAKDCIDPLFAKQLLFSLEQSGKKVFPNFNTSWHFDDKVGQKYLLESIGAPLVPTYVFYTKETALQWIENTTFPKVFKLRGGATSANVRLIANKNKAKRIINKAFGNGFSQFNGKEYFKEQRRKHKEGKVSFIAVVKSLVRSIIGVKYAKVLHKEKGYVYFQDFIPNNNYDIRVIVIKNRAFGIKRLNREGDFRASGSGNIIYDKNEIPEACVKIAFEVSKKANVQCIGYDFVFDKNNDPLLLEMSYGFVVDGYNPCPGYWDENMTWHEGKFNPQSWMVENLIK